MNWLKRLLGKNTDTDSKCKGIGSIDKTQGSSSETREFASTSFLKLSCIKCRTQYSIGENAIIVTMDMTKELLDKAIILNSTGPSADVVKDLVSLVSGVPTDQHTSVLMQAIDTACSVSASLKAGQKRVWICYQCKALNDYPSVKDSSSLASSISASVSKAEMNAALLKAAEAGNLEIVNDCLVAGADVNVKLSTGATPLMLATFDGHTDIVRLLLENGANPNCKFPGKNVTPLMIAAQNNHIEIIRLLLGKGADPKATTNEGVTAMYIAEQNCHIEIIELLA